MSTWGVFFLLRRVDPDFVRQGLGFRGAVDEPFGVLSPGILQGALALFEDALGASLVDIAGGEHGDTGVSMLVVVPGEEGSAERGRGVDVVEAAREAGMVLEGFELGFGERVVVADPGSAE